MNNKEYQSMKKIVKKLSNSVGITFSKEERRINHIEIDDIIEIEIKKENE